MTTFRLSLERSWRRALLSTVTVRSPFPLPLLPLCFALPLPAPLLCWWKPLLARLGLSEATFDGILHWASTCTALLRAALACFLAAVCEVYARSSVAVSNLLCCARHVLRTDLSLHPLSLTLRSGGKHFGRENKRSSSASPQKRFFPLPMFFYRSNKSAWNYNWDQNLSRGTKEQDVERAQGDGSNIAFWILFSFITIQKREGCNEE